MIESLPPAELAPGRAVAVWKIDLDAPAEPIAPLERILTTEERQRAARFVFPHDASRFRLCRAALRLGLSRYLRRSPAQVELTNGAFGKPRLVGEPALFFNVAHSGSVALIAFGRFGEIGIDVEAIRLPIEAMELAAGYLTKREADLLAGAETDQQRAAIFYRFWARKEALLKAAGVGIPYGLERIDVSDPSDRWVELEGEHGLGRWQIRDFEMEEGYAAAIALPPGEVAIRRWEVSGEAILRHLANA